MRFLTDEEYESYWDELGGTREAVARDLARSEDDLVLDIACGWGYYTFQLASNHPSGLVIALDVIPSSFTSMRRLQRELRAPGNIEPLISDASKLPLRCGVFDLATSFLGMRDIHMVLGREGVEKAIGEMSRATSKAGRVAIAATPPDLAETEDMRVAVEVEGEVFGARSLSSKFYRSIFEQQGIRLDTRSYRTGLKMTADQTRTELREGIKIAREIYHRDVPDFAEVWQRYGPTIERHGYGMYSKITVFLGEKG
ncbi:MAG: class I SAM-dependent methyltransferase [Candidatus Bathyarchaeota archaeon]|nr:class I SAM-dependent methyltransferase [Candidatus Bathyarchaeota archaeon]MDH5792138.1 class I SAM-dependent methyltransferase [Candidatus Bathyarchaeota archaeon]